jgi:hypothetical protein
VYQSNPLLALTVFGVAAQHLLTLQVGHDWGDDLCLYVHHPKNSAEGSAYADTDYLYNPNLPVLSPRPSPSVYPLLHEEFRNAAFVVYRILPRPAWQSEGFPNAQ